MKQKIIIELVILTVIGLFLVAIYRRNPDEVIRHNFKSNMYCFEIVKDYMLNKPLDFMLSPDDVNEIQDEEVRNAAERLFNKLNYQYVLTTSYIDDKNKRIVTVQYKNNNDDENVERGVAYIYQSAGIENPYFIQIDVDWYYYCFAGI